MGWILNRAGQQHQEGPYEDAHILHLIQSGQLREGFISVPGSNQWMALGDHPPFAQALRGPERQPRVSGTLVMSADEVAARAAERSGPAGWQQPAPTGQPAQGYAPTQAPQHHGGMPGGMHGEAPGAPPPGWGGAAQAMPPTVGQAQAPRKKSNLGLIIGGAVGVVALVGGAALAMFLFAGSDSKASELVPDDLLAFVEFPDSAVALKNALGMDFLDPTKVDAEKQLDQTVKGLVSSFGLDKGEAEALVLGIEGVSIAFRKDAGRDQFAMLTTFRSGSVVEPWLGSDRVTKEGKFGSSGERYFVTAAKDVPAADAPAVTKALAGMSLAKESKEEALVWFADKKVLCMGHVDLLDDIDSVISKGDGALAQSELWKRATFAPDSALIGYLSPDVLDEVKDEEGRKLIQGYLDGVAPFTMDTSFDDAGIVTRLRGELKGSRISEEEALPNAIDLELPERLPTGTVGYVAIGSEHTEDGKTLKSRMVKQVRASDEGAATELEAALTELETASGVSFERLIDAIGNELLLAVVVDPAFKLGEGLNPEQQLDKVAGLLLAQVGKEEAAADVVKQTRVKLFEEGPLKATYVVKQQGLGFQGLPNDPKLPTVQVFFHEGRLLVGVGGKQLLAKALLALGGKDSLASDDAHQKALKSLSAKPRLLAWVDSGRIGKTALDALPPPAKQELAAVEKEIGVSHQAVRLEGSDRITGAAALFAESKGDVWTYSIETLNAPALGMLGVLEPLVKPPAPEPPAFDPLAPTPPTVPGVFLPQTGVPQCDGLYMVMFQCGERTGDATLSEKARGLETSLKTELAADPGKRASAGTTCSQELLQFIQANPKCTGN
jgi:hypothetical protein